MNADNDVWVGGFASDWNLTGVLYHWDGTRWTDVSSMLGGQLGAFSVEGIGFANATTGYIVGRTIN